jgi:hypothetical protein
MIVHLKAKRFIKNIDAIGEAIQVGVAADNLIRLIHKILNNDSAF